MSALNPVEPAELAASNLDQRFRRGLMAYFLSRVGDRAEAEDLTQQVFLRVLGGDRSEVTNASAFIFRVAANLLLDRARDRVRHARSRTVSLDDETIVPFPSDPLTPERIVVGRESVARVLKALEELGETTRDIFMLFRFENLRQREIAQRLGMSQGAVEKHVMRATLHLLRAHGGEQDGV